jgi:hypothetical protein
MNNQLICDGISLDLKENIPFPFDFSIADIKDFTKRSRNKSKDYTLGGTNKNKAFFMGNFSYTSTANGISFDATQKQEVHYYKKGLLIFKGVMQLKRIRILQGEPEFEVKLFSEVVDIFLELNKIKVSELDWSAYDHTLSKTTIQASWAATAGTGYYYPLIERGKVRIAPDKFRTTDLVPYVYVAEIFTKAFALLGYTISSTYLNSTRFKNILWGYGGGELITVSPTELNRRKVILANGDYVLSISHFSPAFQLWSIDPTFRPTNVAAWQAIPSTNFLYTETQDILNQHLGGQITISRSGNYKIDIAGVMDIQNILTNATFTQVFKGVFVISRNGSQIGTVNFAGTSTNNVPNYTLTLNNSYTSPFNSGDVISWGFTISKTYYKAIDNTIQSSVNRVVSMPTPITVNMECLDTEISDGSTVNLSLFMPEDYVGQIIEGFVKKDLLYVSDPDKNNVVTIEPMVDYYLPTNQQWDISELVDQNQVIDITPTANNVNKNLIYKFKQSKDFDAENYLKAYEEEYGDLNQEQANYYAKGDTKLELPFSTVVPYEVAPKMVIPRFVKANNGGTLEPYKGNSRIMFRTPKVSAVGYLTDDAGLNSTAIVNLPLVHHFDTYGASPQFDLNFKLVQELFYVATVVTTKNSFSEYNFPFINELASKAGMLVKAHVKLTDADIQNLNWAKLINYNGALFRLNAINDFDSDVSLTAPMELVKVLKAKKANSGTEPYTNSEELLAMKMSQGLPLTWTGVASQPAGEGLVLGNQLLNNMLNTVSVEAKSTGVYELSGFFNLGSQTEISYNGLNDTRKTIQIIILNDTTLQVTTNQSGTPSDTVLPNLTDDAINFTLTVKNYQ